MSENIEYGMTTWDEVELDRPRQQRKERDPYMRLQDGPNIVRIISRPAQYVVHKWNPTGAGYGKKVYCSKAKGSCPLCETGDKPKRRWLAGIIDRANGSTAVLDMGPAIFKSVQEFARDEDLGDPGRYDINIKVDREGGATGYYTVIPKPPKPLSEEDLALKEGFDLEDLERRASPPTPEKVLERMQSIRGDSPDSDNQGGNTAAPAASDGEKKYSFKEFKDSSDE